MNPKHGENEHVCMLIVGIQGLGVFLPSASFLFCNKFRMKAKNTSPLISVCALYASFLSGFSRTGNTVTAVSHQPSGGLF